MTDAFEPTKILHTINSQLVMPDVFEPTKILHTISSPLVMTGVFGPTKTLHKAYQQYAFCLQRSAGIQPTKAGVQTH